MAIDIQQIKKKGAPQQTEFLGARVDKETKQELEKICEKEGISISRLIYSLIKDFLNYYKSQNQ